MGNTFFMSYDADAAGRTIGQAILHDNPQELYSASERIQHGNEVIFNWATKWKGKCFSSGGDQGLFELPAQAMEEIEQLRKDYEYATGLTVSVGIGNTLSESGKALLVAKFRGKNQTVTYDDSVEVDIVEAQRKLEEGTATEVERKLGEAYLKPKEESMDKKSELDDCEYCREMPQDEDHCKYCHDVDHEEECPYCKEMDGQAEGDHEHTGDDCEYCREAEAKEQGEAPADDTLPPPADELEGGQSPSDTPADPTMNPPFLEGRKPGDGRAPGLSPNYEVPSPENTKLDVDPQTAEAEASSGNIYNQDEESREAMKEIVSAIDADEEPTNQEMNQIDDVDTPAAGGMDENVSRPEDYDENIPADMGLAEDEVPEDGPDLSGVLKEGLDHHAESIQREKVVQLIGDALEKFKNTKNVLEKAKEQAPDFYDASISMLKAMIEMARMLGLSDGNVAPDEEEPQEDDQLGQMGQDLGQKDGQLGQEGDRPDNREPAHFQHPSKHAAPKEGAADPKKTQSQ